MAEISITFDGAPVTQMGRLVSGEVETATNLPSRFRLVFTDPTHTLVSDLAVILGSETVITTGTTELFSGEVTALEAEYDFDTGTQVIIRGYDKLHRLQTGRAAQTFPEGTGVADVVSTLAEDSGLEPGDMSGAPTSPPPWIGQRDISAFDLLTALAEEAGAVFGIAEGALYFVKPTTTDTAPEVATPETAATVDDPLQLVPDNNLLRVRAVVSGNQQATSFEVHAWDTIQDAPLTGAAAATTTAMSAGYEPADAAGSLSGGKFVSGRRGLPDQASADQFAAGLADRLGATTAEIEGIAVLTPEMQANVAVSLGNLGSPFEGKYVLSSVRHQFSARTGDRTFFAATGRQDRSILGLTTGGGSVHDHNANRFVGVVNGIVTDVVDPNQLGRVKVQVPMLDESFVSDWARVVSQGAGNSYGSFLPPNVNDEVLLAFESNDLRRPVVIGGLYNGQNPPLLGDSGSLVDAGMFTRRGIVSTLGDMLIFFDGASKEGIALMTSDKQCKISLNMTESTIGITALGSVKVNVTAADGDITLQSQSGDVSIQGNNVNIQAKQAFSAKSNSGMSLQDGSSVSVKAASVSIN